MRGYSYLLFALLMTPSLGKIYERCELAREFHYTHGLDRNGLGNWVCLAYYESSYNTNAVGGPNGNGSYDYGIFQINDGFWCYPPDTHADCNMSCSSLTDNDITNDVTCAKLIYNRHGFEAWYGWINNCQGTNVESWVSDCF
ncbi:unnamed protein product [Darwinula stevensoni]|uniref:lysozyme n=1 Tax=Darwinula stevensoni TaxID=69355 RepID=A0A7R9A675_9CRUS|nr:unnamed protein product [Darwinula stevensoni]CAG0886937.1 unnamed protein product [Darwinula stevensoni]